MILCTILSLTITLSEQSMENVTVFFTGVKTKKKRRSLVYSKAQKQDLDAVITLEEILIPIASMAPAFIEQLSAFLLHRHVPRKQAQ